MLHALPVQNVLLRPCPVAAAQLTAVLGGHYCASCQRVVQDFTQATSAELTAARAAAPDGRVCGRFRLSQLAPESRPAHPQLPRRLRQFLLVAVLVMAHGLTARQAWAQVQPRVPFRDAGRPAPLDTPHQQAVFLGYVEKMPQPPGGMDGLLQFLRKNIRYPHTDPITEGKVFVSFMVQVDGQLTGFKVLKGLTPAFDAEALRVLRLMPAWTPGEQNGRPVAVSYTVPITFTLGETKPVKKARR